MNSTARSDLADPNFVRAVLRNITWKRLLMVQIVGIGWHLFHYIDGITAADLHLPLTWHLSGLVIQEFTVLSMLFGAFAAREAVNRGAAEWAAYPLALLTASFFTGVGQWYVRHWLSFKVIVDLNDYTPAARKWGHMLYIGVDTFVYGAFVMLVFANWQRQIRYVKLVQAAELHRAQIERELSRSKLAAMNARVDPDWLLAQLKYLRALYESAKPAAERELDLLVRQLRLKTATADSQS